MKDDRKLWERPWSLKELRGATESWTLAADAGVSNCVVCVRVCCVNVQCLHMLRPRDLIICEHN